MMNETPAEQVDTPIQSTDYSQGYRIIINVHPDRFAVSGPSPLPQIPEEKSDEDSASLDLPSALKSVIAIYKEHPLDSDEASHFEAGYKG